MTSVLFHEWMHDQHRQAAKLGIDRPVVLLLSQQSEHACALYRDHTQEELEPNEQADPENEMGPAVILAQEDAMQLLRQHAGQGGQTVADMLHAERDAPAIDFWLVWLMRKDIRVIGYSDGQNVFQSVLSYDHTNKNARSPAQIVRDNGPNMFPVVLDDGRTVQVYGRTGDDVMFATILVGMVTSRRFPLSQEGKAGDVKLTDDLLAGYLRDVMGKRPVVIAEAIMALRKLGKREDAWLTRVLWGRADLRPLAKQVQHELTGE